MSTGWAWQIEAQLRSSSEGPSEVSVPFPSLQRREEAHPVPATADRTEVRISSHVLSQGSCFLSHLCMASLAYPPSVVRSKNTKQKQIKSPEIVSRKFSSYFITGINPYAAYLWIIAGEM